MQYPGLKKLVVVEGRLASCRVLFDSFDRFQNILQAVCIAAHLQVWQFLQRNRFGEYTITDTWAEAGLCYNIDGSTKQLLQVKHKAA
jgi:hypothetical protein